LYPQDAPSLGGSHLGGPAKSGVVTFVCAGAGDVTFAGPNFSIDAGAGNVVFRGSCFRFHVVGVGWGGYSEAAHDVTFDGVHMDSFNCAGCVRLTIENSEVGPFVACYAPGDGSGAPSYAYCDPNSSDPTERYWASVGGSNGQQQEPYIHNGAAGPATDVTLDHDRIHGISSKWNETHTGGLMPWNTKNLHITYTTFDHNAIYDVLDNMSVDDGLVLDHDSFGVPVYSFDPNEPSPGGPLPNSWRDLTFGGNGAQLSNAVISNNTFANGIRFQDGTVTYSNVLIQNNQLGTATMCGPYPGVTFTGNDSCG
jgi:hypothetical protein